MGMGSNRIKYTARAFQQDAANAMRGDIVRGLIELITNCDDAYGDTTNGKIRIEVEHRRNSPWRVVVRDRAKGMRREMMAKAIGDVGARVSGFEDGARVRGNLGRGAKDVAAFGPVTFESICDGQIAAMTLESDGTFDDPTERRANDEERGRLGIKRGNGTVVTINVRKEVRCPQHGTLLDKLSKHYQLRDINSDSRRDLTLVDANNETVDGIRYGQSPSAQVVSRELEVLDYPNALVFVTISRTPERYENPSSDAGRPEGLLLKGRRAIYENTLFSFENNPHAHWFAGSINCEHIDELASEYDNVAGEGGDHSPANPIPIISRTRDGLEHDHPFYKALVETVEPLLSELVREEEKRAKEKGVHESVHLRRMLDSLGRDLGQLVDGDLREIDEDGLRGGRGRGDAEPLRIIPTHPVLYIGEDKTLSVVALRSLGQTEIEVDVDPEGVIELLDGSTAELVDHPRREDCLISRVRIRPLIEEEETLLTVRCGSVEVVAEVEVRAERDFPKPEPPTELEFERARYQLAHGKRRSILIRAPVELVNSENSTAVRVISSDAGIVVFGGLVNLEFDEEMLCFLGRIQVDPRVLGANATVTATLGSSRAACEVVVAEREAGGPRLDIKILDEAQGRYRAYVDRNGEDTTILILGRHPAIKRYLGPGPEFPNQDSQGSRIMIAEIVAGEAARFVMERKYKDPGDLDGPAFYAEHLRYLEKYLPRCHRLVPDDPGPER